MKEFTVVLRTLCQGLILLYLLMSGICHASQGQGHNIQQGSSHFGSGSHSFILRSRNSVSQGHMLRRSRRATDLKPTIESLAVVSKITSRFAQVEYTSVLTNEQDIDGEAEFLVYIPETAFISNFTMQIGDEFYIAEVDSKENADKRYDEAKDKGETAGKVESVDKREKQRNKDEFSVKVNVASKGTAEFVLYYMELLDRRLGVYEQSISIRPSQVVDDLSADVFIYEPQGIEILDATDPLSSSESNFLTVISTPNAKRINYAPTKAAQEAVENPEDLNGDLIIKYDVTHSPGDAGSVVVDNGYYVHYFSPSGLDALNKNIVFVIDRSGSMSGQKILQTKDAMIAILNQLKPEDYFKMILFESQLYYWPSEEVGDLVQATEANVQSAIIFLEINLIASGGTNINDGLVEGCNALNNIGGEGANMIAFLTDGQPTSGVTSEDAIVENVLTASKGLISIFSIGFGFDLNYVLLDRISSRTGGFARRVYEDLDAAKQLENFFTEINTPLIFNLEMNYPVAAVEPGSITNNEFSQYFEGSELVVCGALQPDAPKEWTVEVVGQTTTDLVLEKAVVVPESGTPDIPTDAIDIYQPGFTEKLWAYMKIKDLLRLKLIAETEEDKNKFNQEALDLALKYNLVTKITSMIIVQDKVDTPDKGEEAIFDLVGRGSNNLPNPFGDSSAAGIHANAALTVLFYFLCSWLLRFM